MAAFLAIESGLYVEAMFLMLQPEGLCRPSLLSAKNIANKLNIHLHVIDKIREFKIQIINYFINSYKQGITPNPCVICNPLIKFKTGLSLLNELSFDFFMTGHFARIVVADEKPALLKGLDPYKDQSYFLHQIPRADLLKINFPLGNLKKDEIKKIAFNASLKDIIQPESQEICFVREDYRSFLKTSAAIFEPGDIVSMDGKSLGTHNGIHNFTIGQRSGLGISDATPYYVVRLDPSNNRVIVGKEKDLFRDELLVKGVNWLCDQDLAFASPCTVKIRYRHKGAGARLYPADDSMVRVKFDEPQRAVTPGQFAVFYEDARVLGGGSICA